MDATFSNHTTPDSLKRKRDALAEDNTPYSKPDGRDKRRDTEKSDDIDQTDMATAEGTNEPTRAADTDMSLNITTTMSEDVGIDSIFSNNITTSDDRTNKINEIPPKTTLQTLPRELRDMIYEYVAATEERIVLGRRMVEARQNNSTWSFDQCFDAAVALHPLSMTCRQFRDEFQDEHISAPKATWVLLVNNFDLEQLQIFSDYIQSEEYIKVTGYYYAGYLKVPAYNHSVTLRFQMDYEAPYSASELCKEIFFNQRGEAPPCLANRKLTKRWLGIADIVTQYVPRTTAPVARRQSMTPGQGTDIDLMFRVLDAKLLEIPGFLVYDGSVSAKQWDNEPSASFNYMQWCWFDEFSHAVKLMREAKETKESARE